MMSGERDEDDQACCELLDAGCRSRQSQLAPPVRPRPACPFVELLEYPVDRTAVSLVPRRDVPSPRGASRSASPATISWSPWSTRATSSPSTTCAPPPACRSRAVVAERGDLRAAIDRYHPRRRRAQRPHQRRSKRRASPKEAALADGGEADEDDAPIVRFVNLLISQAHPGPRLRHPHRAGRARRAACGTASTACCTRCRPRPRASRTASSRA